MLVGADGAQRAPNSSSSTGGGNGGVRRFTQTFGFGQADDIEPAKLKYSVVVPRDPARTLQYRFENIPLPTWEEE